MDIIKNSIWELSRVDGLADGLYRILENMIDLDCVILFPLIDSANLQRPQSITLSSFKALIKRKSAYPGKFSLPTYLLIDEDHVPTQHRERRDKNYNLIEGIVNENQFLFDYATKKRVPRLAEYAVSVGVDRKAIARLLNQYWRLGQDKSVLLPAFSNSGGSGKERIAKKGALGAPKTSRTLSVTRSPKFILSATDKDNFKKTLKKHYLKPNGKDLKETYKELLRSYYHDEVRVADALVRAPIVPSFRQFSYWKTRLFSSDEIIKKRTTERDYLQNKRGLLGSATQGSPVPGSCFEIDATVADVHIVSSFGKQYALGRPTIYSIVDRASRMIVGFHVSLYHASWRAARQALVNCFLPKAEYCKAFGVEIDNSEWPCAHIPQRLMCDNGEMIGLKPQELVVPLTELQLSPPYRPDFKSIVEQRFRLLNKEVLHDLLGTTRGGTVIRGSRDPKKDSIYTLKDLTTLLIQAVLEHNRTIFKDLALSSPLLVENDISPTPLNCWKIHLSKHRQALKRADQSEVIAKLLPPEQVSMTRSGILFNDMYYSCDQIENQNLASKARANGQWRLDARIDENTTNYIYVRLNDKEGFTKCHLLPRSKMLRDNPMAEAEFLQDWIDNKKESSPITVESIDVQKHRRSIELQAKKQAKLQKIPNSEKMKDTRNHRNNELDATTNNLDRSTSNIIEDEKKSASSVVKFLPRRNRK